MLCPNKCKLSDEEQCLEFCPKCKEGTELVQEVPHKKLKLDWFRKAKDYSIAIKSEKEANILGSTRVAIIHNPDTGRQVQIPSVVATPENVAGYGARLIGQGDYLQLEIPAHPEGDKACGTNFQNYGLPSFKMSVGENYTEQYLKDPLQGGGAYLEMHDLPHLHIPMDAKAGGYLMLGKFLNKEKTEMAVTAFEIPFGSAIYTHPYTLHQDAFLTGNLEVVYANAKHFETSFLYTKAKGEKSYSIADMVVVDGEVEK